MTRRTVSVSVGSLSVEGSAIDVWLDSTAFPVATVVDVIRVEPPSPSAIRTMPNVSARRTYTEPNVTLVRVELLISL